MEKLISPETIFAICTSLKQVSQKQSEPFSIVLHGGEPLLLGSDRLEFLLGSLRNALPFSYPISIQSNGMLVTKSILDICAKYKTSIAISIDGPKHVHNKSRVTHQEIGTFEKVIEGYELLRSHPKSSFLNAGLLAVIDPESDPSEVYFFFKSLKAPSVDFLYKDGNHTRLPNGKHAIDSVEYGRWMVGLLDVYLNDPQPIPIRVLDDMIKVILGGMVSKEGIGVNDFSILVIDTDGTLMKNDTLKSSYNGADKFGKSYNIRDTDLCDFLISNEYMAYRGMQRPTALECQQCTSLNVCGGGMLLHRWENNSGYNNTSVYCSDQLLLITKLREAIRKLIGYEV